MSKPAAITAKLVDVRNVATHKCLRLEIHVPYEDALKVTRAFGWPTLVEPVDVAVARLDLSKVSQEPPEAKEEHKERKAFTSLPLVQQIALRCGDPEFEAFIRSRAPTYSGSIAQYVRDFCGVASRSEIKPETEAAILWEELDAQFFYVQHDMRSR